MEKTVSEPSKQSSDKVKTLLPALLVQPWSDKLGQRSLIAEEILQDTCKLGAAGGTALGCNIATE